MSFGFSIGDFIAVTELARKVRKEFADAPRQFEAISDEVRSLSYVLGDIEVLFDQGEIEAHQIKRLEAIAEGCQKLLAELETALTKYIELRDDNLKGLSRRARRVWKRLKWEPDEIRDFRSRISSNISLLNAFNTQRANDNLARLVDRQNEKEYEELLNWLSPDDYSKQHSDLINRVQAGTGQWILHSPEFDDWVSSSEGKILYFHGIPGAGKTMLAAIIIDELNRRHHDDLDICTAYVYFNFKKIDNQSPLKLFSSLLRQLVQNQTVLPHEVASLWHGQQFKHSRAPLTFEQVIKLIDSTSILSSKVFLVVDALDECRENDGCRSTFLTELFRLQSSTGSRLLVTSRPLVDIMQEFDKATKLEIRARSEDVRAFLDGNMYRLPRFVQRNAELQKRIKETIESSVDGMFLLAQLHLTSLVDRTSVKDMKNALEKLPKGSNAYDKAYEEAMARINSQSEGLRILANRVLSWIIFAKRLLNIVELQHALAIESNTSDLDEDNIPDVDQMISICTGLITLDQENKVVRVAHYTIQEYFVRAKMQWFVAAETDITNACITYLSYTVFESGPCSLNPDYTERLQQYLFYGYAALHWGLHARDASLPMDQVVRFLQNQPCLRAAAQGLIVKNETWILPGEESWQLDGLHIAAYFGLHNVARQLIQQGSSLKSKDFRGRTPLSYAAAQGQTAMVKLLFEADESDVDTPDDAHEQTPLWYAATNGHTSTVELLLTTGEVHVNSRNYRGLTPLIMASRGAYIDIVELFVRSKDLDPNSADEDGWTALHHASSNGTLRIIELLLNVESINMEPEDNDYVTPLMIAARYGGKEATEKLLSTGKVNVNARRPDGPTPLAHAVLSGHEGIVKLLLSYPQLEVDCKNNWGVTPLALAVGTDENVVKLLLDSGKAIADLKDAEGSTPLARAANWDRADIVKILLDTGQVDPDSKDSNGRTPLSLAASHSGPDVIRQLLHIDIVDQNSRDQRDWTPLRWAIFAGSDRGVRGLLESSRIEIDVKDEDGRTPLFFAVERASLSIVKQLLDTGQVDVDAQDSEGDTPMTLAAYAGIPEFFPILQALQGYKKTLQLDAEEAPTGRIRDQTESNSEADLVAKLVSERARLSPSFKGPASGDPFALSDRSLNHMDKSAKKTSLKKGASVDTAVAKKVTFETEATLLSYTY